MQRILTQIIKKGLQVTKDVKLKKVQNVLEHFAGDDIANKASILASIVDKDKNGVVGHGKTHGCQVS